MSDSIRRQKLLAEFTRWCGYPEPPRECTIWYDTDAMLAEIDRLRARCRQIDDEAYDYAEQIEQLKVAAKDSADHYADARAEIDRLRDDLQKQADWADWAKGEIDRLRDQLYLADQSARSSSAEAARLGRILAALLEPSDAIVDAVTDLGDSFEYLSRLDAYTAIRAAVAAAEQEVGRE